MVLVLSYLAGPLLLAPFGLAQPQNHHGSDLRINQIQVVGTHNSYHREPQLEQRPIFDQYIPRPEDYYYSHARLADQLTHQGVRSLELDLHSDTEGGLYANPLLWKLANLSYTVPPAMKEPGIKVFHVVDADQLSVCRTFVECLTQLREWSDANSNHVPITVDLELKSDRFFAPLGGVNSENWTISNLDSLDNEIRSVLPPGKLITPDDVRNNNETLEQSILHHGWPRLEDSRGKFLFYMDNDPDDSDPSNPRVLYRANGRPSLQNRVLFTNSLEGADDGAVIKYNNPNGAANMAEIQRLVRKGYIVRTRSDVPIATVLEGNTTRRRDAFASGAQIVSTDWPEYGMAARYDSDFVVKLPGGRDAVCNPVSAPESCRDRET
ncbi:hypothetical protein MBLNU230_g3499t1 [Neophaeotheca triangularis]